MILRKRGFCGIGIFQPSKDTNIGGLFRSAYAFKTDMLFTIGKKYFKNSADTVQSIRHIPYFHFEDYNDFISHLPKDSILINVEKTDKSIALEKVSHPERAIYLLGNEGYGIPAKYLGHPTTHITTEVCLNVATAGSIVLYDRAMKCRGNL